MTSAEIRQSFLDFFREKQHTIVPSSSLLPDAPNLLFTNAGMNQFVPYFLGQKKCPYSPPRVADTQKCIRAGGKHNDLEDVGQDTYHHTFFEMLGNWSFGDSDAHDSIGAGYFKREAIDWAWELLVERWKFPPDRLYATYFAGDEATPADIESRELWLRYLPAGHVLPFGRSDNFWMMADTGPCGPNSEIHIDLTAAGHSAGQLVNKGTAQCIEIWNLVFIQYNATGDPGEPLVPLPAKHVDTGMGFERICAIIQCTDGLRDFSRHISNYETDVFRPIFEKLEELSGKRYAGMLPSSAAVPAVPFPGGPKETGETPALLQSDIAFRVIADHSRCLSFAIADGIAPSNEGRGYVLRRILRRAVRYGRNLGFHEPFFYKLADVVAANFGDVFPELRREKARIETHLKAEEESFNRTLDRGIEIFEEVVGGTRSVASVFPADAAFKLYDTYGFPLDLTELMARERGLTVDVAGFEKLMDEQRRRAREDYEKKKATVTVVGEGLKVEPTKFLGYDNLESESVVEAVVAGEKPDELELVLDRTPFYAEAGGQVGDTGLVHVPGHEWTEVGRLQVLDTQRQADVHVHRAKLAQGRAPEVGEAVRVAVDAARRANVQRHHTVTHLFHWALHEVVSRDARQRGSLVAPDHLRFDFNHPERLTESQIADIERLVNERIREDAPVHWFEVAYADIKGNPNVMQFFGEKYGDIVRVVQIGGRPGQLDGFSMELCGGTHTRTTGEIGSFKISRESAIAAGVRRIEAVCGRFALDYLEELKKQEKTERNRELARELEKELQRKRKAESGKRAEEIAEELVGRARAPGAPLVAEIPNADAELLRAVIDALRPKLASGIVVLGGVSEGKANLICYVTPDLVKAGKHAGKIVGELAKICGGGGGGRPDLAQAGGKQPEKLAETLAEAPRIVTS
jgi:alanyl-tRNA synthetase